MTTAKSGQPSLLCQFGSPGITAALREDFGKSQCALGRTHRWRRAGCDRCHKGTADARAIRRVGQVSGEKAMPARSWPQSDYLSGIAATEIEAALRPRPIDGGVWRLRGKFKRCIHWVSGLVRRIAQMRAPEGAGCRHRAAWRGMNLGRRRKRDSP